MFQCSSGSMIDDQVMILYTNLKVCTAVNMVYTWYRIMIKIRNITCYIQYTWYMYSSMDDMANGNTNCHYFKNSNQWFSCWDFVLPVSPLMVIKLTHWSQSIHGSYVNKIHLVFNPSSCKNTVHFQQTRHPHWLSSSLPRLGFCHFVWC